MIQVIYENAATLLTTLVDGKHGHVRLIMKETLYITTVTGKQWEEKNDLNMIPTIKKKATITHRQQANKTQC